MLHGGGRSGVDDHKPFFRHFPHGMPRTFFSKTAVFDPAERHDVRSCDGTFIDLDRAESEIFGRVHAFMDVGTEHTRGQSIRCRVGPIYGFFERAERADREHWSKSFLGSYFGGVRHVRQDGWCDDGVLALPAASQERLRSARIVGTNELDTRTQGDSAS